MEGAKGCSWSFTDDAAIARCYSVSLVALCLGAFLGSIFIAIGQGLLIIGFAVDLARHRKEALAWKRSVSCLFLVALIIFSAGSVFANLDEIERPLSHLKKLRYHLLAVLLVSIPVIKQLLVNSRRLRDFCVGGWLATLIFAVFCGLIGIVMQSHPILGDGVADINRGSGLYSQVMTFAYGLQFSVIALAVLVVLRRGLFRELTRIPWWVAVIALVVAIIGLYFTYTRGAVLGVVVAGCVAAVIQSRWWILVIVIAGLAIGGYAYKEKSRYFHTDQSLRVTQWKTAALTFVKEPLTGVGYRNFEKRCAELKKEFGMPPTFRHKGTFNYVYFNSHAHNNFLETFASTGVFGGLALIGFCVSWLWEAAKSRRYAILFVPLVSAFLVSGFFENTFSDSEVLNVILLMWVFSQLLFEQEGEQGVSCETSIGSVSSPRDHLQELQAE